MTLVYSNVKFQIELLLSFLLFGHVEALPRNARNLKRILKLMCVDILHITDILVEKCQQPVLQLEPETKNLIDSLANPVCGEDSRRDIVVVKSEGISIEEFCPGRKCVIEKLLLVSHIFCFMVFRCFLFGFF